MHNFLTVSCFQHHFPFLKHLISVLVCYQISKSFAEGRTSLESYVFFLKATVGIHTLVDCVSIGKGKMDLTSLAMEPVKTNQVFPFCPTVPSGKACSSLTCSDIIKFLTGGFRLSKARCNDIFWEAVWPRLLARGWHSEQPRNQGYATSKDYLVFLMPGIKKFSRRKLVKGDHYFDSVSDILNKVASEPKLIELEVEVSSCNDDQWVSEELSDQDDPSTDRPHCYLKPLTSNCNLERMKFLVIDSSLVHGGQSCKMRELRHLPVNFNDTSKLTFLPRSKEGPQLDAANMPLDVKKNTSIAERSKDIFDIHGPNRMRFTVVDTSVVYGGKSSKVTAQRYCPVQSKISSDMIFLSRVDEGSSSGDSVDEQESNTDTPLNSEPDASDSRVNGNIYNYGIVAFDDASSNKALNSDSGNNMETHQGQEANKSEDKKTKRTIKHHFSRRAKSNKTNSLAPLVKRRRLTACAKTETSSISEDFSVGHESKNVRPCCALNLPAGMEISRGIISESCGMEMSCGKNERHQNLSPIDLNTSRIPFDSDNGEVLMTEVEDRQAMNSNGLFVNRHKLNLKALNTSVDVGTSSQQSDVNPRRHSTRNRPPTAKALEALACGFLNTKKKQKSKEFHTQQIPFSNPSRRARSRVNPPSKRGRAGMDIVDMKKEKKENKNFIIHEDIVSQPLDQFEKKSLNVN